MRVLGLLFVLLLLTSCSEKPVEKSFGEPEQIPEPIEGVAEPPLEEPPQEVIEPEFGEPMEFEEPIAMAPPEKPAEVIILIRNAMYEPKEIKIDPGTKVTWVNMDRRVYKINEGKKRIIGERINPGGNFSFTFSEPGIYTIFDSILNYIQGEIIVREPSPATALAIAPEIISQVDSIAPAFIILAALIPLYLIIRGKGNPKKKEKKKE